MIKSLWASVQGDPVFMRKFNGWMTVFWIVMLPISVLTGLVNVVAYVSLLSIYALVTGHMSSWQAARVEVKQDEAESEHRENNNADLDKVEQKVDDIHTTVTK